MCPSKPLGPRNQMVSCQRKFRILLTKMPFSSRKIRKKCVKILNPSSFKKLVHAILNAWQTLADHSIRPNSRTHVNNLLFQFVSRHWLKSNNKPSLILYCSWLNHKRTTHLKLKAIVCQRNTSNTADGCISFPFKQGTTKNTINSSLKWCEHNVISFVTLCKLLMQTYWPAENNNA